MEAFISKKHEGHRRKEKSMNERKGNTEQWILKS